MSVSHLSPEQRRLNGQIGGRASAAKASVRRLEKWQQWGVPPEVGERIYMAGYACRVAQERRKKKNDGAGLIGQAIPDVVETEPSLSIQPDHYLTVGRLRQIIAGLPNEMPVFYERIEDVYFERHGWKVMEHPGEFGPTRYIRAFDVNRTDEYILITAHY